MKPIAEVYPDFKSEYTWDYDPLLQSFGHEILLKIDDEDYQGDSRLILRDNESGAYGLLIFGWGSCTGCDALQGCRSLLELEELRESIHKSITWRPSCRDLLNYIEQKDWETEFMWHEAEGKRFVHEAKQLLANLDQLSLAQKTV